MVELIGGAHQTAFLSPLNFHLLILGNAVAKEVRQKLEDSLFCWCVGEVGSRRRMISNGETLLPVAQGSLAG